MLWLLRLGFVAVARHGEANEKVKVRNFNRRKTSVHAYTWHAVRDEVCPPSRAAGRSGQLRQSMRSRRKLKMATKCYVPLLCTLKDASFSVLPGLLFSPYHPEIALCDVGV